MKTIDNASESATTNTLVLSEVFGPTLQGEGPSTGRRASFIRLGGCNLSCSFCDTPYTWDSTRHDLRKELTRRPVTEVLEQVEAHDTRLAVITGGEPLLHQEQGGWSKLLAELGRMHYDIEIETNGTIVPRDTVRARYNVSPKLAHSGDPESARIAPVALTEFAWLAAAGRAVFKFVCRNPTSDLSEVDALCAKYQITRRAVWIMPEGVTPGQVLITARDLADPILKRGYNLSLRTHVLLWSGERSR